jgi:predicted secreted protein
MIQKLMDSAMQNPASRLRLQNWDRIIQWNIDDDVIFWAVKNGQISPTVKTTPQIKLSCSGATLAQIATGELPLFLAIWATNELKFEGSFADAFHLGYVFLNDARKRRVAFVAHCFLNTNTRFPGGSAYPGATVPLIELLLQSGIGIIQMPCAEFCCFGLEKELYGELPEAQVRSCFQELAQNVINQIEAYKKLNYEIVGIIGMNPSPSCGVEITKGKGTMIGTSRDTSEQDGPGVFIEELQQILAQRGLSNEVPVFGFRRILPGESGNEAKLSALNQRLNQQ